MAALLESKPFVIATTFIASLIILLLYFSASDTIIRAAPIVFWIIVATVGVIILITTTVFVVTQTEKLWTLRVQMKSARDVARAEANKPMIVTVPKGDQVYMQNNAGFQLNPLHLNPEWRPNGHYETPRQEESDSYAVYYNGTGGHQEQKQMVIEAQSVTSQIPDHVNFSDMQITPSTGKLALGVSSQGIVTKSINDMVHIAIAGVTRSGKSIFIQQLIYQIINAPEPTELHLIDLGGTTFIDFGLPYASTIEHAEITVHQVMDEAHRRKALYEATGRGIRSLAIYNEVTNSNLSQIILAIDEALYLMEESRTINSNLKLAVSWAAKYGITIIFISQDIKANTVSTSTRNNFSTRFQFLAEDEVQANILVKGCNAHLIKNKGRCFARFPGDNSIIELQTPFVTEAELVSTTKAPAKILPSKPIAGSYDERVCRVWYQVSQSNRPSWNKMHQQITHPDAKINGRQKEKYMKILKKYGLNPELLKQAS